jgi:molecular chaperone GrpE
MSTKQQETRHEPKGKASESPTPVTDKALETETPDTSVVSEDETKLPADERDAGRIAILEAELAAAREELSEINDKYLRKLAEDVNFRKRMMREKEEGQRFAITALLGDIIPILDDFDRAISSAETLRDYAVLHDGVILIKRQLGTILETKYGLSRYESLNKPFDPNRHEAVAMVQGGLEDGEEAVVAEEFLPGYSLHERILRTAKVRVRMPAPQAADSGDQAGEAETK